MLLFEHKKRSAKLQSSKSNSKGDILFNRNHFSKTTTNDSFGLQRIFSGICDITKIDEWDETWLSCTREGNECYHYVGDTLAFPRQTNLEWLQSSGFKLRSNLFDFDAIFTLKLQAAIVRHDIDTGTIRAVHARLGKEVL